MELTPRRGKLDHIVLLEYVEEYPLILGLPGMNSRIETYIRRIEGDRTCLCLPMPQQLLGLRASASFSHAPFPGVLSVPASLENDPSPHPASVLLQESLMRTLTLTVWKRVA